MTTTQTAPGGNCTPTPDADVLARSEYFLSVTATPQLGTGVAA